MKVLQLIDSLDAGGAERMAVHIANATAKRGIPSFLCSTSTSGPLEQFIDPAVSVHILKKRRTIDVPAFTRFFTYVEKQEITIIHAHSTSIQLAVLAKMRFPKIKIVWHDHYGFGDRISLRPRTKLKMISPFIDATIAVNEKLAQWSRVVLGSKNVFFITNFSTYDATISPVTELKGTEGKRVICLANLRSQKNHIALLKAFKESIKDHPKWTLHLVGKDFNDPYSETIYKTIKDENLKDNVFIYGTRLDIAHILQQASIGVLSSISEGLPLSLIEYGMNKLPVITTDVGQCKGVIGTHGILISDVIKELPQALIELYTSETQTRDKMGINLYTHVRKMYSEEAFMRQLVPIYKDLVPYP